MTLILSVVSRKHAIQVSDRRVVRLHGDRCEVADDNANKAIFVRGQDCNLAISICGMFSVGGKRVTEWLARRIANANRGFRPWRDILRELQGPVADALVNQFNRNVRMLGRRCPTNVIVVGAVRQGNDSIALTCEGLNVGTATIGERLFHSDNEGVNAHGFTQSIPVATRIRIRQLGEQRFFRAGATADVVEELVRVIRDSAAHPEFGHFVGRDCMSVEMKFYEGPFLAFRRHVADAEGGTYRTKVVGSPVLVLADRCVRWKTDSPNFSLGEFRLDGSIPEIPPGHAAFDLRLGPGHESSYDVRWIVPPDSDGGESSK